MKPLSSYPAKRCETAAGILINENKVLLILHKKIGFWMPPGGHVEKDELPHIACEREFFEETGLLVKVVNYGVGIKNDQTEYLPIPFACNLHWINQDNFHNRLKQKNTGIGCEQHYTWIYLVKIDSTTSSVLTQNENETDGIGWFAESEIDSLQMIEDIKAELHVAFSCLQLKCR